MICGCALVGTKACIDCTNNPWGVATTLRYRAEMAMVIRCENCKFHDLDHEYCRLHKFACGKLDFCSMAVFRKENEVQMT